MALRVGIVIERWKLAIFKKALDRGGFEFEKLPGVIKGTYTLTVETDKVAELQSIVRVATAAAAKVKNRRLH